MERSEVPVMGSGEAWFKPQAAKTIIWLLLGVEGRLSANDNNSLINQEGGGAMKDSELGVEMFISFGLSLLPHQCLI